MTRSHKSYSLTSSPFNNESISYPSRPRAAGLEAFLM